MQLKELGRQHHKPWSVLTKFAVVICICTLNTYSYAETDPSDLQLTIAFGDSLGALSLQYTGSIYNVDQIVTYNDMLSADSLTVGDTILIPANLLKTDANTFTESARDAAPRAVIDNVEDLNPARPPELANSSASEVARATNPLSPNMEQQQPEGMPQTSLDAIEKLKTAAVETSAPDSSTLQPNAEPAKPNNTRAASRAPEPSVESEEPTVSDQQAQPERPVPVPVGLFDVDEEAAKRALERSLSQDNAVLLRYGQAEIGFSYDYAYDESLSNILIEQDGQVSIGTGRSRACFHGLEVTLRSGLPWDSQFEIGIPYKYNCATTDLSVGSQFIETFKNNGSGSGDARFALLKTISNGANGGPSIVARISASPGNGKSQDGETSLGGGTATTSLGLQMSARQDPMVYSLGLSATHFAKDDDNIQLGNQFSFSARTYLSTSPSNSISLGLSNTITRQTTVENVKTGPDGQMYTYLNLGFSSVLRNRNYVAIDLATGLNDAALDLSLSIIWTKRFSWSSLRK